MAKKRPIAGPRLIDAKKSTLADIASGVSPPTRMIFMEDSPEIDIALRGDVRSKWIDNKCEDKQWDSDTDISSNKGPSYNAIDRDRSSSRRYSLTISLQIRNLTNHNNPGPIIGNITSPLFGMANQPAGSGNSIFSESANNCRLELQTRLTF